MAKKVLTVRLEPAEYERLKEEAWLCRQSLEAYVRGRLFPLIVHRLTPGESTFTIPIRPAVATPSPTPKDYQRMADTDALAEDLAEPIRKALLRKKRTSGSLGLA